MPKEVYRSDVRRLVEKGAQSLFLFPNSFSTHLGK